MIDNLESMDNSSLREKCIQYGLPNVPVTNSSRNVLIRRLRVSMGNLENNGADIITRRESMNLSKKPMHAQSRMKNRKNVNTSKTEKCNYDKFQETAAEGMNIEKGSNRSPKMSKGGENLENKNATCFSPTSQLSKSGVITTSFCEDSVKMSSKINSGCNKWNRVFQDNSKTPCVSGKSSEVRYSEPYALNSNYFASELSSDPSISSNNLKDRSIAYGDENVKFNCLKTPYLSEFTRSLERVKDDALYKLPSTSSNKIKKYGSLGINQNSSTDQNTFIEIFQTFLIAVEQRYHLKRNFAIIFIVFLLVFLYVICFM